MVGVGFTGGEARKPRRWLFADCVFDEGNWSLTVAGARATIESKPLRLLRELLRRRGGLATKDELLDAVWPDVAVVEASLPTAVAKLRRALGDQARLTPIIETVSGLGYRLGVPAEVELLDPAPLAADPVPLHNPENKVSGMDHRFLLLLCLAVLAVGALITLQSRATASGAISQREAASALRRLDVPGVEALLAAGWNPNRPFDREDNAALQILLGMCEWDRDHDRRALLLMVRTLVEGGARLDHRNVWGDTPYSIAKAERYCGPRHPVTRSLHSTCYAGFQPLGDRCLASYELARRS